MSKDNRVLDGDFSSYDPDKEILIVKMLDFYEAIFDDRRVDFALDDIDDIEREACFDERLLSDAGIEYLDSNGGKNTSEKRNFDESSMSESQINALQREMYCELMDASSSFFEKSTPDDKNGEKNTENDINRETMEKNLSFDEISMSESQIVAIQRDLYCEIMDALSSFTEDSRPNNEQIPIIEYTNGDNKKTTEKRLSFDESFFSYSGNNELRNSGDRGFSEKRIVKSKTNEFDRKNNSRFHRDCSRIIPVPKTIDPEELSDDYDFLKKSSTVSDIPTLSNAFSRDSVHTKKTNKRPSPNKTSSVIVNNDTSTEIPLSFQLLVDDILKTIKSLDEDSFIEIDLFRLLDIVSKFKNSPETFSSLKIQFSESKENNSGLTASQIEEIIEIGNIPDSSLGNEIAFPVLTEKDKESSMLRIRGSNIQYSEPYYSDDKERIIGEKKWVFLLKGKDLYFIRIEISFFDSLDPIVKIPSNFAYHLKEGEKTIVRYLKKKPLNSIDRQKELENTQLKNIEDKKKSRTCLGSTFHIKKS